MDGSVQALSDVLEQLGTNEVQVDIVHRGVGAVNESDVLLAQTAGAVIIGLGVRPQTAARQSAEREGVDIRVYDVIYEAVDQVTEALEGMLAPERRETVEGTAEVRETFKITKLGTIAGCYVSEGRMDRKGHARVIRDGIVAYDSEVSSLKRFKDDVKEVREGFECGIGIKNFNDVKVGDLIECYTVEEVARTLSGTVCMSAAVSHGGIGWMVIASVTWELSLPGCSSLKEKRSVLRSLRDRLRNKFNVSVAETAFQDAHGRAQLTVALVASDGRFSESVLNKVDRFVECNGEALIISVRRGIH